MNFLNFLHYESCEWKNEHFKDERLKFINFYIFYLHSK